MNIIKKNRILLYVCLCILALCLAYHLIVYFLVKPFVFQELTSAKILGSNEKYFFVEMKWNIANRYIVPYKVSVTESFFFENEVILGEVEFVGETQRIGSFKPNELTLNATIPRDTFQLLMSNMIDQYAFHMVAYANVQSLFFKKEMRIDQFLPVNINRLMIDFLSSEFGNRISVKNVYFQDIQNQTIMTCEVDVMNRGGLELFFRNFEGRVSVNPQVNGTASAFTPVHFLPNETAKTMQIVFRLDNLLQSKENIGYTINGSMQVNLWSRTYRFTIELIGEV